MRINIILLLGIAQLLLNPAYCEHTNRDNFIELKVTAGEPNWEKVTLEWEPRRPSGTSLPVALSSCKLQLNSTSKLHQEKSDTFDVSVHFKFLTASELEPSSEYKIRLECNGTKNEIWNSDLLSFSTGSISIGKPSMREYLLASMGKAKSSFNTHLSLSRDQLLKNIAKLKSELLEWKQKMPFLPQQ